MAACVRLRLQRLGVRNNPHYRIVAAHREAKRDGRFLENLGNYCPIPDHKTGLKQLQIKKDRVLYWVAVGAEPSSRVAWLLAKAGLLPEPPIPINKTVSVQPKRKAQERMAEAKKKADEAAKKNAEADAARQKSEKEAAAKGSEEKKQEA